jgi:hypothetical protein
MNTTDNDPIDEILRSFLGDRASDVSRIRSAEQMTAAMRAAGGPRSSRSGIARPLMVFVVLALLMTLVIATIGGEARLLVSNQSAQPALVAPSPTVSPSVEPSSDRLTSETSIGTIAWTRVESERSIQPWMSFGDRILGVDEDREYWLSTNAIDWEPWTAAEARARTVARLADGRVLVMKPSGGYSVMMGPVSYREVLSRDWIDDGTAAEVLLTTAGGGEIAQRVALPEATVVPGLRIDGTHFGTAAVNGNDWIVPVMTMHEVPWGDVIGMVRGAVDPGDPNAPEGDVEPWPIWDPASQRLGIYRPSDIVDPMEWLTVEPADGPDGASIEFRDATSGTLRHSVAATLPGWTPEELLTALRGWGLDDISLLVSRDGEATAIRPPWPMGEEFVGMVAADGAYFAVTLVVGDRYNTTEVHLWKSGEGSSWERFPVPVDLRDGSQSVILASDGDDLLITIDGPGPDRVMVSDDGRDWTTGEVPLGLEGVPYPAPFGWILAGYGAMAAVSADGVSWERLVFPFPAPEFSLMSVNDLLIVGPTLDGDRYVSWVGRLDR